MRPNRTDHTFYLSAFRSISFVGWGPDHGGDGIFFFTYNEDGEATGKVNIHHENPEAWRTLAKKILTDLDKTCTTCGAHHDNT